MRRTCAFVLLAAAVAAGAACKRKETPPPPPVPQASTPQSSPVSVVAVTLGKEIGLDKRVMTPRDGFAPADTIYASVDTSGAAATASLSARWTYQDGQTVHEETQTIAPTGAATTEFHISKPDGFPTGGYSVEILLNGVSARKASFRVG